MPSRAAPRPATTLADNEAAFRELGFVPTVADKPAERDQSTVVMGQHISMPVMISPTGVQMVHPEAELGIGRAAAARGTAMGLSSFGATAVEAVVEANPQTFFQIYWCGTRESMAARIDRAKRAGVVGLIVTLDWSFSHGRDWGSPSIPESIDLRTAMRFAPDFARHPRYSLRYRREMRIPDLSVPNMVLEGERAPGILRGLRPVDGHAAPDVGRPRLAARAMGGSVHAQGHHGRVRRPKGGRRRASAPSASRTTAATTSTRHRRRSAPSRSWPTPSATRSRS